MRKWTPSACVVLAWCILPLLAVAGSQEPGLAQANTSTATSNSISTAAGTSTAGDIQVVRASQPVTAVNAEVTAARGPRAAATWTVRPGDTLSAIATALGLPGGWRALYAANRQAIGPDPDLIRSGTVLAAPRPAASGQQSQPAARARARQQAPPRHQSPAPASSRPPRQAHASSRPPRPLHQAPAPAGRQGAGRGTAPGHATASAPAGGMPRWLQDVLIAVGVLAATAFAAEPAAAVARRRRRGPPRAARAPGTTRGPGGPPGAARRAADKARIILADHERLIVTYCARDNAVYVLTPPGEDPRAILNAARLVLPEDTYEDLAGHLGVPSAWPLE